DLILLDIMMPRLDGFAVCAELRRLSNPVPILMLTAKGQVEDRVHGLDVGADDYLVKPFSMEELLARVRALLRRLHKRTRAPALLTLGEIRIALLKEMDSDGTWRGVSAGTAMKSSIYKTVTTYSEERATLTSMKFCKWNCLEI